MNHDENEFEYNGKTYIAIDKGNNSLCDGCEFQYKSCGTMNALPGCNDSREDKRTVIFVEKNNE